MVDKNRDEMNFIFWMFKSDVWNLTPDTLRDRLLHELGANAAAVLASYTEPQPAPPKYKRA